MGAWSRALTRRNACPSRKTSRVDVPKPSAIRSMLAAPRTTWDPSDRSIVRCSPIPVRISALARAVVPRDGRPLRRSKRTATAISSTAAAANGTSRVARSQGETRGPARRDVDHRGFDAARTRVAVRAAPTQRRHSTTCPRGGVPAPLHGFEHGTIGVTGGGPALDVRALSRPRFTGDVTCQAIPVEVCQSLQQ